MREERINIWKRTKRFDTIQDMVLWVEQLVERRGQGKETLVRFVSFASIDGYYLYKLNSVEQGEINNIEKVIFNNNHFYINLKVLRDYVDNHAGTMTWEEFLGIAY